MPRLIITLKDHLYKKLCDFMHFNKMLRISLTSHYIFKMVELRYENFVFQFLSYFKMVALIGCYKNFICH